MMPYCAYIPKASLCAVIIAAVIFMVDYQVVKPMWKATSTFLLKPVYSTILVETFFKITHNCGTFRRKICSQCFTVTIIFRTRFVFCFGDVSCLLALESGLRYSCWSCSTTRLHSLQHRKTKS